MSTFENLYLRWSVWRLVLTCRDLANSSAPELLMELSSSDSDRRPFDSFNTCKLRQLHHCCLAALPAMHAARGIAAAPRAYLRHLGGAKLVQSVAGEVHVAHMRVFFKRLHDIHDTRLADQAPCVAHPHRVRPLPVSNSVGCAKSLPLRARA